MNEAAARAQSNLALYFAALRNGDADLAAKCAAEADRLAADERR